MKGNSFECACCGERVETLNRLKDLKWKERKEGKMIYYCSYSCYSRNKKNSTSKAYCNSHLGWSTICKTPRY